MYPIPSPHCKYAIYTRRSSESEEKQVLSIEGQLDELQKRFGDLNIVSVIEESGSAFKPNNRPEFNALLQQISSGEISGIIAWHPDRISRNPLDAAQVVHLIQTGKLQDLKFATYPFHNSPDGIMMLQIALSQSQFFSSKLSVDVKRGMNKKRDKGWRPSRAPAGYLNDPISAKGEKKIYKDPDRFPLLKQAFEMMVTGLYSVGYIQRKLNQEWGYLSRKTKHIGGKPMSVSGMYKVFENKFYAGIIVNQDGSEVLGNHTPMVTIKEFEQIQQIMRGRKGSHKKDLEFPFKPLLTCGSCGGKVTAERKMKKLANGTYNKFHYYHCTHNSKTHNCKEPSIEEKQITKKLIKLMSEIMIHPILKTWTMYALEHDAIQPKQPKKDTLNSTIKVLEKKLDKLDEAYYEDLIPKEDFKQKRAKLSKEINTLKQSRANRKQKLHKEQQAFSMFFDLLSDGKHIIENGSMDEKRDLLQKIASNYFVKDRNLALELYQWVIDLKSFNRIFKQRLEKIEPSKNGSGIDLINQNRDIFLAWSSLRENIRTVIFPEYEITKGNIENINVLKTEKPKVSTPSQTAYFQGNLNQEICQPGGDELINNYNPDHHVLP